jgi:subtilisin
MKFLKLPLAFAALALGALAVFGGATNTTAAPDNRVNVFVAFNQTPGPAEEALIRRAGGTVKYSYTLVPAIAASLPQSAIDGLSRSPGILRIEPDIEVFAVDHETQVEAELAAVWGVTRIGSGDLHHANKIGTGIRVAILDSGIDTSHADLHYDSTCSNSTAYANVQDGNGHGTHVAGTIAATRGNGGVVGAAPGATLCIFKVLSDGGGGSYSDVVAALNWISNYNSTASAANKIRITNNSYGSSGDPGATVKAAFDNLNGQGVLHIAAAGNSGNLRGTGSNCIYPALWDSLVATAATTSTDTRASFSSTCSQLELAAPGRSIYSTVPGGYATYSGTSMASPHAAGAAALVWAENFGQTNAQVRALLTSTALDLGATGPDTHFGHGLVQAGAAVAAVGSTGGGGGGGGGTGNGDTGSDSSGTVSVTSIIYATSGGKNSNKNLVVTIAVGAGNDVVSGATVSFTLTNGSSSWNGSGTTGTGGTISATLNNAPSGTYRTTIHSVSASGLTWDGVTPANGFTK